MFRIFARKKSIVLRRVLLHFFSRFLDFMQFLSVLPPGQWTLDNGHAMPCTNSIPVSMPIFEYIRTANNVNYGINDHWAGRPRDTCNSFTSAPNNHIGAAPPHSPSYPPPPGCSHYLAHVLLCNCRSGANAQFFVTQ